MVAQLVAVVIFLDELLECGELDVDGLEHHLGVRGPVLHEQNARKTTLGDHLIDIVLSLDLHQRQVDVRYPVQYAALAAGPPALHAVAMEAQVQPLRFVLRQLHRFLFMRSISATE